MNSCLGNLGGVDFYIQRFTLLSPGISQERPQQRFSSEHCKDLLVERLLEPRDSTSTKGKNVAGRLCSILIEATQQWNQPSTRAKYLWSLTFLILQSSTCEPLASSGAVRRYHSRQLKFLGLYATKIKLKTQYCNHIRAGVGHQKDKIQAFNSRIRVQHDWPNLESGSLVL